VPVTQYGLELAYLPWELTVLAQALPRYDEGDLLWDEFYVRQDVESVELLNVTTLDYRPTADRREWNARGRRVPAKTPARRQVSIVPIEANDKIDEKAMQHMMERSVNANVDKIREIIGISLPARTKRLAEACYRRLEVDAMAAWANGAVVQRNPENAAQTYSASFGFSASRYTTAGTAWNDGSVNAYTLLLAWIAAAEDLVGPIQGAMTRLNVLNAILADAPNLPNAVTMTRTMINDRVSQDIGHPFELIINEQSVDIFDDGGTAYTRTKVWPAGKIAAIPQGGKIGMVAFAPVIRAMEMAAQVGPAAGIDTNGVTVHYGEANDGRELNIEAQLNAMPVPDEQKLYVTATGIA
jgi:hypothetical protein